MKGILRWFLILGVLVAVVMLALRWMGRRRVYVEPEVTPWVPPTVEATPTPAAEAEAEPELDVPAAEADLPMAAPDAPAAAAEAADAPGGADEPADLEAEQMAEVFGSEGLTVEPEPAQSNGTAALVDPGASEDAAADGDEAAEVAGEPEALSETNIIEGFKAFETEADADEPAAPEASAEAPEVPGLDRFEPQDEEPKGDLAALAAAPAGAEPEFLTRYFEELAATPEEGADQPAAPELEAPALPATETYPTTARVAFDPPEAPLPEAAEEESLPATLEEALAGIPPEPISTPPRRNAESYLDEGNVYFNVGQYSLAIDRYTQAIELDAGLVAAYYNRANARTRATEFDGALQDYDRALELQPSDADALNNRGMLHLYRSNYAAALRDFNGALAADPGDTTVMVNRGLAHLHGGDAASALGDFREAVSMDPTDAAAHYGAGQAAAALGDRESALEHVGRALQLDPAYAREAAGDPKLVRLQGDEAFLKLLRDSGTRSN